MFVNAATLIESGRATRTRQADGATGPSRSNLWPASPRSKSRTHSADVGLPRSLSALMQNGTPRGASQKPEEGSLDHVVPRSRGGKDAWENLVWSSKDVNTRKGNRLPHEAGLELLAVPRAPKELPASALIRNAHSIPEWKLFGQLFRKEITYF